MDDGLNAEIATEVVEIVRMNAWAKPTGTIFLLMVAHGVALARVCLSNTLADGESDPAPTSEAAQARFQTIFEHAQCGLVFIDARTGEVIANPEARRIFGGDVPAHVTQNDRLVLLRTAEGREVPREAVPWSRALSDLPIENSELILVQPGGREVPVRVDAAIVRGVQDAILGVVVVYQDLTTSKELERLRDEWTSLVAHDLRQPVTIITGFANLLARQIQLHPNADEQRAIGHVLAASRQLNHMISDLLDVSRIESRRLRLNRRRMDLFGLIRSVADRFSATAGAAGITVTGDSVIPPIIADPERIERVLTNLLSNAAKYGEPAGQIQIEMSLHETEVEVSVRNHGPGILAEELPRIFSRFYRASAGRSGTRQGLGLGLYVCKGLIEAHAGRIWAESVPGDVTRFSFTLPLEKLPLLE